MKSANQDVWCVYIHETPNSKKYIGITSCGTKKRWRNGNGYNTQVFGRAVKKYGWDNIRHIVVKDQQSHQEAVTLEQELIERYETQNPQYGYNQTIGGEGLSGYAVSEKTRELQSSRRKGTSAPGYGKPMSDKAKKIVSDKLKKRTFSQDTKEKMKTRKEKVVYQYTLCGELVAEYPSAKQASSVTGTNIGNLCACCRNVVRQANGFFWSYSLINNRQAIVDHLNGSKPFSVLREGKNKPVVRFSHDQTNPVEYKSITEASISTGYRAQQISHCCSHPDAVSGPYKWRYKTEWNQ